MFSQLKTLEEHEAKHKKARHVKTGDPKKRAAQLIAEKRGRKSIAGECPPEVCWSLTQFYSVDFFTIKDRCKKSAFSTNQGLRQRFFTASGDLFCTRDSVLGPPCPCISVVLEATHEASRGSGTETEELLRGTEENSVSPTRGHQ